MSEATRIAAVQAAVSIVSRSSSIKGDAVESLIDYANRIHAGVLVEPKAEKPKPEKPKPTVKRSTAR